MCYCHAGILCRRSLQSFLVQAQENLATLTDIPLDSIRFHLPKTQQDSSFFTSDEDWSRAVAGMADYDEVHFIARSPCDSLQAGPSRLSNGESSPRGRSRLPQAFNWKGDDDHCYPPGPKIIIEQWNGPTKAR